MQTVAIAVGTIAGVLIAIHAINAMLAQNMIGRDTKPVGKNSQYVNGQGKADEILV